MMKVSLRFKTFLTFALVGALTAIFYFALFTFLYQWFYINYNIALSIAYVFAITFYFFANRHLAFKSQRQIIHRHSC